MSQCAPSQSESQFRQKCVKDESNKKKDFNKSKEMSIRYV